MESTQSSNEIITNLKQKVDTLIGKLCQSLGESIDLSDAENVNKLENGLHETARELADTITGVKLQEHLVTP